MFSYKTFQFRLFITYLITILFFATVIGVPMYLYLKGNIEDNISGNVEQKVETSSSQVDTWFHEFANITSQLYLDNTDNSVVRRLDALTSTGIDFEQLNASKSIYNSLSLLTEIHQQVHRVSIYNVSGNLYSNKDYTITAPQLLNEMDLSVVRQAKGATVVRMFDHDPWISSNERGTQPVISFSRQLRVADREIGFLEVQFTVEDLLQVAYQGKKPLSKVSIVLFSDQTIIFPFSDERSNVAELVQTVRSQMKDTNYFNSYLNSNGKESSYAVAIRSTYTPLTVMYLIPKNEMLASLKLFRNVTFLAVALLILLSAAVFYILSRTLTAPLIKLRKAIDSISLDERSPNIENKWKEDAIDMLNRSFRRMNERLQISLEEAVQFRTMQLRSHFEVLQAQINPHFLFNMLGVIKALADRERNDQISEISGKLAQFLQYPISTANKVVDMGEEIKFVSDYLHLIKTRYLHRLTYTIDVPKEVQRIKIPKLTIQPLVENCIKYGFTGNPTLIIHVHINIFEDRWELLIKDNGQGFQTDKLANIYQQMNENSEKIGMGQAIDPLTIGGMGLISTYIRLKLLYKEELNFIVGNGRENGAFVLVSGKLDCKER
ncbi:histidine kinase [Paenibacillus sp. KS-LC4]|uniref:sensor histidine kinase n=1 Tax=Paenibacillus sp. KS-LC4 TaxID=2979727 RepID=UPI0030D3AD6F